MDQIICPIYKARNQDKEATTTVIYQAEKVETFIPKSIAGESLLSEIIISKYVDHLPVYRQLEIFKRLGVKLSDATVCGWMQQAANQLQRECYSSGGTRKEELLVFLQPRHGTRYRVILFFTEQLQTSGHQSRRMLAEILVRIKDCKVSELRYYPHRKLETQTDSR